MNRVISSGLAIAVSAVIGSQVGPVWAQDKITLRVADSLPVGHYIANYTAKPWMDEVKKVTNGRVQFEYYPSEQLGKAKDLLSLTVSGVTDIGYVAPSYVSDKMPLSAVAQLPGSFTTACQGTMAYWELASDGILAKREMAPNGVRLLFTVVAYPYQIFTSKQKLEGVKSIAGLKLRTTGGAMDIMMGKLKGVPIQMAGPEVYDSLSRGTLDGLVFPFSGVLGYDLQGLVKWATFEENFGSFVYNYVISERRFKQLPPDVQTAMTKLGAEQTRKACALVDRDVKPDIEKLKKAGVTFVSLPAAEKEALKQMLAPVSTEWAAELDRRGKAGAEVLKAFQAALATKTSTN